MRLDGAREKKVAEMMHCTPSASLYHLISPLTPAVFRSLIRNTVCLRLLSVLSPRVCTVHAILSVETLLYITLHYITLRY